jgi:NAD(P)H dehydrogenase (quinone)
MKVGIFVHSQSGNTAKLALAITHALRDKGHTVDVELLRPIGKVAVRARHVEFRTLPETDEFDTLLVGGPIWGFTASPVVVSLLNQLKSLKGKKVLFFLTSGFPSAISGCKGAQTKVKKLLEELGATVLEGESLSWGFWCSKKRMEATVEKISRKVIG